MPQLKFKPTALTDLKQISEFIAQDNPYRGMSFIEEIRQACLVWAETPFAGRDRSDLREGIRSFPHAKYVIFYQPLETGICIVRVLHGSRDHKQAF